MTNLQRHHDESAAAHGYPENPASYLEKVFSAIYKRDMQGLPVVNERLQVEAVGFRDWEGHWLGVLVTPWFINLMLLPKSGSPWPDLTPGKHHKLLLSFPAGDYQFTPRLDEQLGSYLCCSLMSPVHEIPDHDTARSVAAEVMTVLERIPLAAVDAATGTEAECPAAASCSSTGTSRPATGLSRRQFLGG